MKPKYLILGLTILILIGCSYNDQVEDNLINTVLKHTKTEYTGCFLEYGYNSNMNTDTIYYELINDTLFLHIIMNQNCGCCLNDSVVINNELVNIFISDTCGEFANCMCDFKFDYCFTDFGEIVYFNVYYKALLEPDYTLWGQLNYPE